MNVKMLTTMLLALTLIVSPAYAKKKNKSKHVPPGLAKNLERGKPLPPGWQKKIAPGKLLEKDIYAHGEILAPLDPLGVVTLKIDDKILRVHQKSMEILQILTD